MKDFVNKIDNDTGGAGIVTASDFNSVFNENENAVKPFMSLDESNHKQLVKSMDIVSKAMFYKDTGSANKITLTRGATTDSIETLFDGMVVFFKPNAINTGATTLKVKDLPAKAVKYNSTDLPSGYLNTSSTYMAVYDSTGTFNIDVVTGGSKQQPMLVKGASSDDEALTLGQFNEKIKQTKYIGRMKVDEADYWLEICDIVFPGNSHFTRIEFMTSDNYVNGYEPSVGSMVLRSGNDSSANTYVTPTMTQTANGVRNIHIASVGGDNKHVKVFVQLGKYSSFYITSVKKGSPTITFTSNHKSAVQTPPAGVAYPKNIFSAETPQLIEWYVFNEDDAVITNENVFGNTDVRILVTKFVGQLHGNLLIGSLYFIIQIPLSDLPTDKKVYFAYNILDRFKTVSDITGFENTFNRPQGAICSFGVKDKDLPFATLRYETSSSGKLYFTGEDFGNIADGVNRDSVQTDTMYISTHLIMKVSRG